MCGRYAASRDTATLVTEFEVERRPDRELVADYNVAPSKEVYVVADRTARGEGHAQRELAIARWGLVPSWAKEPKIGNRMINARWETAAEKPAYRAAFARRRCLLPADGYYEWYQPEPSAGARPRKQPYYIRPADGSVLAMAGLYEFWRDPGMDPEDPAAWLRTTTILTTRATDELGRIHDRMPMCVQSDRWRQWLDPAHHTMSELADAVRPASPDWLRADPVSAAVGNVRNNGAELTKPIPVTE